MSQANHILVAVDFSPCAASAFRQAKRIAAWLNAPLTVLHVVSPPPPALPSPIGPMDFTMVLPSMDDLVARARQRWGAFAGACGGADDARFIVEAGNPRTEILAATRREKARMLLVGAHATRDANRGIGTTAAACAQWASSPVMVVRGGSGGAFRSVVACIDFSDTSRLALEHAISVATEDGATLHVLHVYDDPWCGIGPTEAIRRNVPDFSEYYQNAMEQRLREWCEPFAHELSAIKPEFHTMEAPSHAEGINAFILAHRCDLAVLGTRGKFNLRDFVWGSTAERVVREAACSVLAIKPAGFAESATHQPASQIAADTTTLLSI